MKDTVAHIAFDVEETLGQFDASLWLESYWRILQIENSGINLVSRETTRDRFRRIVAEALLPFVTLQPFDGAYLDIGSGGGIPSIPLLFSGRAGSGPFVLFERTKKKADALSRICSEIGFPNIEIVPNSFGETPVGTKFSLVTVSWVTLTRELLHSAESVMKPGASLVYYSRPKFALTGVTTRVFSYSQTPDDIHKYFSIITK